MNINDTSNKAKREVTLPKRKFKISLWIAIAIPYAWIILATVTLQNISSSE